MSSASSGTVPLWPSTGNTEHTEHLRDLSVEVLEARRSQRTSHWLRPAVALSRAWSATSTRAIDYPRPIIYREEPLAETKITVRNNGPLRIEGEFTIYDMEGKAFDLAGRTAISLCRCGHSANKPFCDSSHKTVGFQSVVQACQLPPPPEPKPPGA